MAESNFITTTFAAPSAADTSGWDTVYAVRAGVINDSLRTHFGPAGDLAGKLVFDQALDSTGTIAMKGELGPWQIVAGGSGMRVNLSIPVQSGTAHFGGLGLNPEQIDLAGSQWLVQVSLGFHAVTDAAQGVARAALKISADGSAPGRASAATIAGKEPVEAGTPPTPVTVTGVDGLHLDGYASGQQTLIQTMIETLAKTWLGANTWIFDYVFLQMDVAETAAHGQWDWLTPTYVGYAYTDVYGADGQSVNVDSSIFAVLAMTEGRKPQGPSATVSVSAIPSNEGVNAGFLIAPERLMHKILLRNLAGLFPGTTAADFILGTGDRSVTNGRPLTLQLEMDPSWYPFSKTCTATIDTGNLSLALDQTTVSQMFSNISFPYGYQNELTINLSLSSSSAMGLDGGMNFTMQTGHTSTSTLSVQPDASKIAAESWESIGVNLVVTAAACFAGFGAASTEAGIAKEGSVVAETKTGLTGEQQEVASTIQREAMAGSEKIEETIEVATPVEQVGVNEVDTSIGTTAGKEMKSTRLSLKNFMPRFTFKMWAMFAGQFVGEISSNWSNLDIIEAYQQHPENMPTLAVFLANCIRPAVWTNTGEQKLQCAGLNGAFVMGLTVPSHAAPGADTAPGQGGGA